MNRLNELIKEYCPNGVPFRKVKDVYTRLKGTPITASKMKEIASDNGEIKIFAGGKQSLMPMKRTFRKLILHECRLFWFKVVEL